MKLLFDFHVTLGSLGEFYFEITLWTLGSISFLGELRERRLLYGKCV
jgi:hypothetical protein